MTTRLSDLRSFQGVLKVALVLALLLSMASVAQAEPERRHGSIGKLVAKHAEQLGLDEATQARIDETIRASGDRDAELREDLHAARERMRSILGAPNPDEASVMAQAEAIESAEAEIHKNRLRAILEIRAMLTQPQVEKLIELRESRHRDRSGKHRGHGSRICGADLETHCARAGGGKARLSCLHDHWDALSDRCREVFDGAEGSDREAPSSAPFNAPSNTRSDVP